jgi:serine/threonine protein kinase
MGEVYRARDTRLKRDVALKVLPETFAHDPARKIRFQREAEVLASLNHPNIAQIYGVAESDSVLALVMELVEGETLRDLLKRGPLADRSLEVANQVLEALRAAHRAGIVHRDLKPANIMIRVDGYVKILDFGIAKRIPASPPLQTESTLTLEVSLAGQVLGTVAYMSPEQILGQGVDQRSDLFAFGVILYEMLTGRHPWPRKSTVDTLHAILHEGPPVMSAPPAIGPEFALLVDKLLRKNPAERYPLAEAVLEVLARRQSHQESSPAPALEPKPLISIAVLPFVFLSEVEERKAFSLGFADALITTLGNLDDVAVTPTSAILNYAPGAKPALVCRDLEVRYVLLGNVQKIGAQWRVSIQLFDGNTQKTTLSEKHDFTLENVFDVQDEIGRRVVESLQTRFARAAPHSRGRYSGDPDAYGEFMAGLRESYSDRRETVESAIQHLSSAVQRDPDFALAQATLSYMCTNVYFNFDPQPAWMEKAEHHCERALALDPALPEGHLARSWILWSPAKNFQHAEAIAELEHVLAAQPNFERAHNRMSAICWHIGRMEEARTAHELARRSNPKTRTQNLEWVNLYSGDFMRAEEAAAIWFREAPGSAYTVNFAAYCALLGGDLELAGQRLAAGLEQEPDEPLILSLQGLLHARRNQTGAALECVRKVLDSPRSFGHIHHAYHQIAGVYALLGDMEKAMAWLERATETGFPCWSFFRIDPHLENLSELPAFQTLVAGLERKYTALKIQRL